MNLKLSSFLSRMEKAHLVLPDEEHRTNKIIWHFDYKHNIQSYTELIHIHSKTCAYSNFLIFTQIAWGCGALFLKICYAVETGQALYILKLEIQGDNFSSYWITIYSSILCCWFRN